MHLYMNTCYAYGYVTCMCIYMDAGVGLGACTCACVCASTNVCMYAVGKVCTRVRMSARVGARVGVYGSMDVMVDGGVHGRADVCLFVGMFAC